MHQCPALLEADAATVVTSESGTTALQELKGKQTVSQKHSTNCKTVSTGYWNSSGTTVYKSSVIVKFIAANPTNSIEILTGYCSQATFQPLTFFSIMPKRTLHITSKPDIQTSYQLVRSI